MRKQPLILTIAILLYVLHATAWAQGTGQIVHLVNGEPVKECLVIGPFFPADLETDLLTVVGGEANIIPEDGDTVTTSEGTELIWKRYETKKSTVDLSDAIGHYEHATAYAFFILQSEVAYDARLCFGHSNGAALWVDGKRVYSNPVSTSRYQSVFEVRLEAGANRCLVKVVQELGTWAFALRVFPYRSAVISGIIANEKQEPFFKASVRLEQLGEEILRMQTDESGSYCFGIHPVSGAYDLSATFSEFGDWFTGVSLSEGEYKRLNLELRRAISIEGTLMMLDSRTPHVAVPVEAVRANSDDQVDRPTTMTLSDNNGKYRFINLKPGSYHVRCQVLDGYVYYEEEKAGTAPDRSISSSAHKPISLRVEQGETLKNIDFRFAPFKKGTWRTYHALDGLVDNSILTIHAGSDGEMWFGTQAGVSRYDGKEFVNLNSKDGLAGNWVFAIHVDPDGVMWFGTNGGASRYDGSEFTNFTTDDGLASDVVKTIYRSPDGYLWFGTGWWNMPGGGVSRYDGNEFVGFTTEDGLADNTIKAICSGSDGAVWFGTWGYGVSRYDGREFTRFTTEDGLASDGVYAIHQGTDGSMWFATDKGISHYDGKKFTSFTVEDGLVNNRVMSIRSAPDGTLWFGTAGGVSHYNGERFLNFTEADGLANNNVESIYLDSSGGLWLGTSGGVSRYDEGTFLNLSERDGLVNNKVEFIHRDPEGAIWIGTRGGVSRYDGKEFVSLTEEDGLANNFVRAIQSDSDGALWFATDYGGVSRYDGKEFLNFTYQDGLADNRVLSIQSCPDGTLWFGTWGGVSRYNGKEFTNLTTKDGLANNWISHIYCGSDGAMWFGTVGSGVSHYDGNEFTTFTTKDGLADNGVHSIHHAPDGTMWFGTLGGVSHYDGQTFINFTAEDGLAHNSVMTIYRASDGALWFGTLSGVSRYDGVVWTSLDTRDGLAGNSVRAIREDSDGAMWFGTEGGITRYRRGEISPRVRITSVEVMGQQVRAELQAIPSVTVGNYMVIEYSAIDYETVPEKRQYQYRIKELDSDWRNPTRTTRFEWTPEEAGTYTFEVRAIDRDLNYSEPASVSIAVSSHPFYHTGAFFLLLSIAGGALLLAIAALAVNRRRSSRDYRATERIQAAKMASLRQLVAGVAHRMNNPAGVISSNTDISRRAISRMKEAIADEYSQETKENTQLLEVFAVVEKMNQVSQVASAEIAKIAANLRRFVRLDEVEWQLANIHEEIDNVIALMESEFIDRIRVTKDYGDIPGIYCSPSSLNQVFMSMFRNAAEAIEVEGEINISTSTQGKHIIIEISDTGKGIPAEDTDKVFDPGFTTKGVKVGVGLGLSICYKIIVDDHKGHIYVSSEPGKGTTFIIALPQYRSRNVSS